MCGTDGLQARGFGLGLVMGHNVKSVRCVWALESAFLRPRGSPDGGASVQRRCSASPLPGRQPFLMLVDAFLDPCTGYSWQQGSALLQHSIQMHFPVAFVS